MKMEKAFSLVQTVAVATVFSAVSGCLIEDLRRQNPNSDPPHS
ncbi:hypothetical protein RchiOBHm_Chr7g0207671 [Rosa chinensis]|uniref:Uncharacterized protein n=1 Tax=Rosa chinensis TaxID=74649 RepID=A0A2P6P9H1_ROSCH|nr:hypothetical protein RchiOBHm_Chr7g0207671 [Rosa chinensis]